MRYALALEPNLEVLTNLVLSELHLGAFQFWKRRKHLLGELESLSSSVCANTNHFTLDLCERLAVYLARPRALSAITCPGGADDDHRSHHFSICS
jgi:hypothetical protein